MVWRIIDRAGEDEEKEQQEEERERRVEGLKGERRKSFCHHVSFTIGC